MKIKILRMAITQVFQYIKSIHEIGHLPGYMMAVQTHVSFYVSM